MPRLLCCLSLALSLFLAACAASSTGSSFAERHAASLKNRVPFTPTPINAPPASQVPTGPARTLTFSEIPATPPSPPPAAPVEEHPLEPTGTQFGPLVMGTPLPGLPTPMPAPTTPPTPDTAAATTAPDQIAPTFPAIAEQTETPSFQIPRQPAGPPQGIAGIAWGSSANLTQGLAIHEVNTALAVITYIWPTGPRTIMGTPIRDAFYEFFQDRFYHVWIDLDGLTAYQKALAELTAAYGPPSNQNPEKYYNAWNVGDVNIYCVYHPTEKGGDVSYFYQPIYKQLDARRKAAYGKRRSPRRSAS